MNNLLIFRENAADMEEKEVLEYILFLKKLPQCG